MEFEHHDLVFRFQNPEGEEVCLHVVDRCDGPGESLLEGCSCVCEEAPIRIQADHGPCNLGDSVGDFISAPAVGVTAVDPSKGRTPITIPRGRLRTREKTTCKWQLDSGERDRWATVIELKVCQAKSAELWIGERNWPIDTSHDLSISNEVAQPEKYLGKYMEHFEAYGDLCPEDSGYCAAKRPSNDSCTEPVPAAIGRESLSSICPPIYY